MHTPFEQSAKIRHESTAEGLRPREVKNQGLIASEQLCRVSISADEINQLILETGWDCPTKSAFGLSGLIYE